MRSGTLLFISGLLASILFLAKTAEENSRDREERVFSIFSVVRFRNTPCRSTSAFSKGGSSVNRNGTCFTSVECSNRNGIAAGTCAAGFGVCCVITVENTGSTVNANCTYIRNPGFPSALTTTNQIQYTVAKCSCDVCFLRLDFECFTILGTGSTLETTGGVCQDTFTISSNAGANTPTICGENTGQHLYIDMGRRCGDTVTLNFDFTGSATTRIWEMKASQIPCGANAPPEGCLQYHNDLDGRLTTFNFIPTNDNHLQNQEYSICIRRQPGYCCIQYQVCADANSMSLSSLVGGVMMGMVDEMCTTDYVGIEGGSATCQIGNGAVTNNKFCGPFLTTINDGTANIPICDCTAPFRVDIVTDALTDETGGTTDNTQMSRGLCLEYTQIPCSQ